MYNNEADQIDIYRNEKDTHIYGMNGEQINTKKDTKNTKNARRLEEEKQLEIHDWSEQSRRAV